MNEQQFLKTMIETVKYDDYSNKDELLGILRYSLINYEKTGVFGNKNNYFREYVALRVPIPMLKKAKSLTDVFEKIVSDVYIEPTNSNQKYEFWGFEIKPKPVDLEDEENITHNVVFDDIKDTIIQGIRNAKYTIWVAVAWFSDKDIFRELLIQKNNGIHVRIITADLPTNQTLMNDLEENFEIVKISSKGLYGKNILHDKFCIIDLNFVMHGSYNWSGNARYNDETWATALDRDFVRKFADEFMRLYTENTN
ncbi:phospholipase D-like domain-containing protein [Bacillus thuringiensis]|uniref:phospholipase D-like domain-containing protein n=1 Tax=Bacillus thuringiensis TaxID=1428 RepID=UPI0021D67807|nr:phospholipase D-like domain-containing protein [Bacillus thuringiensis]MCU7679303.1 phospholipase D-like domain-containing protein [Bacillus thuringiensis]